LYLHFIIEKITLKNCWVSQQGRSVAKASNFAEAEMECVMVKSKTVPRKKIQDGKKSTGGCLFAML